MLLNNLLTMSRKLFTQLRNEWRTNIWLAVELLIVSVVMWYVVDYFYVAYSQYMLPRGFNIDHTYLLTFNELTDKSPDFDPDLYGNSEKQAEAKREILARLARRPEVEAASLSQNSYPYDGSNSGLGLRYDTMYSEGYLLRRMVTPDFVKVFRYEGVNGETPEQLAQILKEGKILASDNVLSHYGDVRLRDYVGKKFWLSTSGDTLPSHELGAAIVPVRYHDYTIWNKCVVLNLETDADISWSNEVCIRVKEDMDKDIVENLMADAQKQFHVGNFLLVDVRSFEDIRRNYQRINTNEMRNMYAGLGFLMLNIFLGLFGTFWFRTRQRVHEIAIRKVNGATDGSIFRRLISEGLLLLLVVTPLAVGIDFAIGYFEFTEWYNGFVSASRLVITAGISLLLMALMIVGGIYIPARKAMKIDPAVALKDE